MRRLATGLTDQSIVVHCFDADEAAVTLTSGSAGLSMSYRLDTAGREGTPVSMTPVARLTAGVHRDGAITSKGGGKHEIDLPDAAFASAGYLTVILSATSVTGRVYSEIVAVGEVAVLDTTSKESIADTVLSRNVSNVESTAGEHTLATAILGMLEWEISGNDLIIKRTDGTTVHYTKTLSSATGTGDVITGLN